MDQPTARRLVAGLLWGVPGGALAAVSGYLTVLTGAAWWGRARRARRRPTGSAPWRRYAVLVPAHDEERLIGSTLDSLAGVEYPAELLSVHVVADNCTDATASIARSRGAEVHERIARDAGGKGRALVWAWRRLVERGDKYDAVVIIDADTTANPGFLTAVDAELDAGARVVQSYYAVRDAEESPNTAFRAAALAARHYLRPLGRTALGGSAGLYGNGMVFATPVLDAHEWTAHLTEDIELQLELLLEGTPVAFAPDAVVAAEMPTTLEASRTQHERWERGRLEMARRYVPALARRTLTARGTERIPYADAAMDLALPPFSVVVAATSLWSGLALARAATRRRWGASGAVAVVMITAQTAYVLSGLRMVDAPRAVYRSLLSAPRLVVWKVSLWVQQLGRRSEVTWVRTARNAERGPARRAAGSGLGPESAQVP
jgi:cellulose synthase/poly-beta-1,6-N-acetylglucosamine synthase-like glycosyltransferase